MPLHIALSTLGPSGSKSWQAMVLALGQLHHAWSCDPGDLSVLICKRDL